MTSLLERLRERAERVETAHAEMDRLHKAMYARDDPASLAPDEDMKFRADGLCLGLADAALTFAESLPAVVALVEAAQAATEANGVDHDEGLRRVTALVAALAPFVSEATPPEGTK